MERSEKAKRKEVEEEEEEGEKKKKKVKHGRISWCKKCKERIVRFFTERMKGEKKAKRKADVPKRKQVLAKSGRWLFLLLLLEQCVNAAAEGLQRRTEMMERMAASRSASERADEWRRLHKGGEPRGPDRTEMRKRKRG